jgi:tripartite-type tricarboxylate transporter receptor subunit TctC
MEGKIMKKLMMACFVMVLGLFIASASMAADEAAIAANVNGVVEAINGGKAPAEFKADDFDPYIYIMEEDGMLLVHPSLQGQSLGEEKYKPVYEAIIQATPEGVWVDYEWGGGPKKAYVRTTAGGLIVGSGYAK